MYKKISPNNFFVVLVCIVVAIAVIAGFCVIDSPHLTRLKTLDKERINALNNISCQITRYNTENGKLPENVEQLGLSENEIKDVATGLPYEYKKVDTNSFQLCAIFDTAEENENNLYNNCGIKQKHTQGSYCFVHKMPAKK